MIQNQRLVVLKDTTPQSLGNLDKHQEESIKYKPAREATIFSKLKELNKGPLSNDKIISIYNEIISTCRSTESDLKVAYLGPEGTYSESALQNKFGSSVETKPEPSIRSVFEEVKKGLCDFGIVPIENSSEGSVKVNGQSVVIDGGGIMR